MGRNLSTRIDDGEFIARHIGPSPREQQEMLATLGVRDREELLSKTIPHSIRSARPLDLAPALSEAALLRELQQLAEQNSIFRSYIGQGYYDCHTPNVILRNILENPGWYTAYTPYQAEISQGRMEALLNFQTMIMDLTGMEIANSSLLDEGTAAAEAMALCFHQQRSKRRLFFVSEDCFAQTIEVLQTRAAPLGIHLEVGDPQKFNFSDQYFGVLLQYPGADGRIRNYAEFVEKAHAQNILVTVAADLLALTLLKPPGEWGADVVVGSTQRFGVPMGFGGPHAAYFATRDAFKRLCPGRFIGVSKDSRGEPALRLALQTREQHIRREKATSNICTAQVLLAVMASMYAVYHGPRGLTQIAERVRRLAWIFRQGLKSMGYSIHDQPIFDTLQFPLVKDLSRAVIEKRCAEARINVGWHDAQHVRVAFDETTTPQDLLTLWQIFAPPQTTLPHVEDYDMELRETWPTALLRTSPILQHAVFNSYHSETEMLRYIHRLEKKDLALNQSMIPLGSCTMKLNATSEMIPVTWPAFAKLHPFAPLEQAQGYLKLIRQLEDQLKEITGFAGVSLQPNAGSQGEYAGLLVIRRYHQERGQQQRNICLIPSSAHGTNPASAVMAGFTVVVVACDAQGNVDVNDLRQKAQAHRDNLAALMITYPSTHGVFEESITEICDIIHQAGGQVYMDGANLNALIGLARPGDFGPDVAHLNLHKTFCIPHGGGGPGVGPVAVAAHLKNFLPKHNVVAQAGPEEGTSAVSAAPWGSASILPISWSYIRLMGPQGILESGAVAILNANYIAHRLQGHYDILYKGRQGFVAHECIIDLRPLKAEAGIEVVDVAKRLIDYGFHAPTMSWPVPGTLMIEPTESEAKAELDRFCDAMIAIRQEVVKIVRGEWSREDNPLKNAPHSVKALVDEWPHAYTRREAFFPLPWVAENKFFPTVGRVDDAYGDRNFVCSCVGMENYQEGGLI